MVCVRLRTAKAAGAEPATITVGLKATNSAASSGRRATAPSANRSSIVMSRSSIPLGGVSYGVAVTPDGRKVYVANLGSNNVFVIDTATNAVIGSPIPVGLFPFGVAITPDRRAEHDRAQQREREPEAGIDDGDHQQDQRNGRKVYVANRDNDNVSVIDTATNTVIATIPVGSFPIGVAVTPDGSKVYVANSGSNNVFVIDTASNLVLAVVSVGIQPVAFGAFIRQPAPFAGTPRESDCHGKSVSALAEQFGGLPAAATARGFSSVPALQDAINCVLSGEVRH
jgi:YVTN family beta-propeller protein